MSLLLCSLLGLFMCMCSFGFVLVMVMNCLLSVVIGEFLLLVLWLVIVGMWGGFIW